MKAEDTVRNLDDSILSTINSLVETQAEISFKAGRQEVIDWVEQHLIYIALDGLNGTETLHFQTNEKKSAEKWQAKLKEWEVTW